MQSAEEPEHYPKYLWKDLEERWKTLNEDQKKVYEQATESQYKSQLSTAAADVRNSVFKNSFTFWDVLWFFLAVGSAYKIGSGEGGE